MTRRSGLAHARVEMRAKVKIWMSGGIVQSARHLVVASGQKIFWGQIDPRKITTLSCATTTMGLGLNGFRTRYSFAWDTDFHRPLTLDLTLRFIVSL